MCGELMDWLVGTKPDKPRGIEVPNGEDGEVDLRGFNSVISKDIDREGAVIANRMTWNLTFHGLLFASLALSTKSRFVIEMQNLLPVTGALAAGSALVGIIAAYSHINKIKRRWYSAAVTNTNLGEIDPQPFAHPVASLFGRVPPVATCGVLLFVWCKLGGLDWLY